MQRKYVKMNSFTGTELFVGILLFLSFDNPDCAGSSTQTPVPTFANQPSGSTTIFEYGNARTVSIHMKCKVSDLQPGQKVSWLKGLDDTVISDNYTVRTKHVSSWVDNNRYSINGNDTPGEYNLQIAKVSYRTAEIDDGSYLCAVFYDDPTILAAVIRSRVVQQLIYVVPRMIYPQCFVTVNNANAALMTNVTEGDTVTLSCQSDPGYPDFKMSWREGNSSATLTDHITVKDDIASVEYTWIANESDVGDIFTCTIGHPALKGERSNISCSVGPFHIQQHSTTHRSTVVALKPGNTNGEGYESLPTTSLTNSKFVSPLLTNSTDGQNSTVVIAVSSSIAAVVVILIIVISIVVCVKISRNKSQHSNGDQKIIGNPYAVATMDNEGGYSEVKPNESVEGDRDRRSGVGGKISDSDLGVSSVHTVDDLSRNENTDTNRILTESTDESRKQEAVYAFPDKSKKTKGIVREDFTEASPERKVAERTENKPPGSKTAVPDYAIIPAEDLAHTNKVNVYDEVHNSDKSTDKNEFERGKDDVNPKMKLNVEGLSYADLDLTQLPTDGKRRRMDENRTVYAELQL